MDDTIFLFDNASALQSTASQSLASMGLAVDNAKVQGEDKVKLNN